jgi:DNA-binding transcriptional ArsR family regulator
VKGDVDIAAIAAVLADPARVRMLLALNSRDALPATDLARIAGVSRSSASFHLTKLVECGLLTVTSGGRHRYFRLAHKGIAPALEALALIAPEQPIGSLRQSLQAEQVRFGRLCEEHLGGHVAVRITDAFVQDGTLLPTQDGYEITDDGITRLRSIGLDMRAFTSSDRFVSRHPDWSEKSHHMAGALASSLTRMMLDRAWITEVGSNRAVRVTSAGNTAIMRSFGVDLDLPSR